MRKFISLILTLAMICSLILPAYAEVTYSVEVNLDNNDYKSNETIELTVTIKADGQPVQYTDSVWRIVKDDQVIENGSCNLTNSSGVSVTDVPVPNVEGTYSIIVYKENTSTSSDAFTVTEFIPDNTTQVNVQEAFAFPGDTIHLEGSFYRDGIPAASADVPYYLEKGSQRISNYDTILNSAGELSETLKLSSSLEEGTYKVSFSLDGNIFSDTFEVKTNTIESINIEEVSQLTVGDTHTFVTKANYANGSQSTVSPTYASSDTTVAVFNGSVLTAVSAGTTTISAEMNGKTDQYTLTVVAIPVHSFSVQMNSTYHYDDIATVVIDESTVPYGDYVLRVKDASNNSVDNVSGVLDSNGHGTHDFTILRSMSTGDYTVSVTIDHVTEVAEFTVLEDVVQPTEPDKSILNVNPIYEAGSDITFSGKLYDKEGNVGSYGVAIVAVEQGARIVVGEFKANRDGEFTGSLKLGALSIAGDYSLVLSHDNVSVSKSFTIISTTLSDIEIINVPTSAVMPTNLPINVVASYTDGRTVDISSAADLELSVQGPATINNGLLTANAAGQATITATYNGKVATHTITIINSEATIVAMSFDTNVRELEVGKEGTLGVIVTYSDNSTINYSATDGVTFTTDSDLVTIENGVIKGVNVGKALVHAAFEGQTAVLEVEVFAATPPVNPPTGGGGGGGGVNVPQEIPQAGSADEAKQLTDKAIADAVEGLKSATDPSKYIQDLSLSISGYMEQMTQTDASNAANDILQMTSNALHETMTDSKAKALVYAVIENTLSKIDKTYANAIQSDVSEMLNAYLGKVTVLELKSSEKITTNSITTVNIEKSRIDAAVRKLELVLKEIDSEFTKNNVQASTKLVDKNIYVSGDIAEHAKVTLAVKQLEELKARNYGVELDLGSITLQVPSTIIEAVTDKIEIDHAMAGETYTKTTFGGTANGDKLFDINVSMDGTQIKDLVRIKLPLGNMNTDQLMIGVYENDQWTKIPYTVEGKNVCFTAPHFSVYGMLTFDPSFTDIDHWAKQYIVSLAAKGIVSGKSEVSFDPDGTITRAEFATIIVNYLALEDEATSNFKDIDSDAWYAKYVGIAGKHLISAGTVDGMFRPEEAITREEMATMLHRAYEVKYGYSMTGVAKVFSDQSTITEYAKVPVNMMRANGIISGYSDNTFKPQNTATRAEASTMMYMFLQQ